MRRLVALFAVVAVCNGCATVRNVTGQAGGIVERPGLAEAESIVWASYGRTDTPPRVRIFEGDDLTCVDPISGKPGFEVMLTTGRACRNGYTISPWEVNVSWHGEAWHETSLAHELQHVAQGRRGIIDPGHLRDEWNRDVPAANDLLRGAGQ